jgi:xylulokinase
LHANGTQLKENRTVSRDLILAQDLGTSAVKTSLVSTRGVVVDSASTQVKTTRGATGHSEQDPESWWESVVGNTRTLLSREEGLASRIAAIGVTGHMLGAVLLDRHGQPLRPALMHSDARASEEAEWIRGQFGEDRLYRQTGCVLDSRAPVAKLLWLHRHEPGVLRGASAVLQSKDFLVHRLIRGPFTTDFSDASHAMLLDLNSRTYADQLLREIGVLPGQLPELHAGTDAVGGLAEEPARVLGLASGIPVVAGAGDGSSASVGAGAVLPGTAYCCLGSTAWIAVPGKEPHRDPRRRVFNITSAGGKTEDCFGTVQSAGATVSWAVESFGAAGFDDLERALASVPPGAEGLTFLPYLDGERSPLWDDQARGVLFGISHRHTRAHLLRASAEGVAYALRSVLEVMLEHQPIPELRLVGGAFRSPGWQALLADVLGIAVVPVDVSPEDATSLGAALIAGVGTGLLQSMGHAGGLVGVLPSVTPRGDYQQVHEKGYDLFRSLYPSLKPHFHRDMSTPGSP